MAVLTNTTLTINEAAAPSTPATGKVVIYVVDGKIRAKDDAGNVYNMERLITKSISVENPVADDKVALFVTEEAITVREIRATLIGADTPSVTWTVKYGTDLSSAGTALVTAGTTTTSTTTGSTVTTFNSASVPADNHVWLLVTAQSGTVGQIHLTVVYTID
jgi:hypothetical protein